MSSSLLNVITYYQQSIEKNGHDEKRLLHCIEKLYKLPVKLEHLQSTGVGKTVNSLRKYDKEVGVAAKALVAKWKAMVAAEVPHEDEDDDLQRDSQDDDDEDDDQSENSQNRDNTQGSTQNGRVTEGRSSSNNSTHHLKQGEHHLSSSSSSSKDKHRNGHETDRQSSRSSRSQNSSNSSSSSRHRHDDRKAEKRGHSSARREEKDRNKLTENPRVVKKEPEDSDSDENDQTDRKLSIVEEIEQDFDVDEDDDDDDDEDDDEEKLVIDVSKEKADEIEKKSKSESQELSSKYRHHSSKNNSSRYESKREKESSKRESGSKERPPKASSSHSKESSHSSREHSKKDSSHKDSSSRSERNRGKDKSRREDQRCKEPSRSRKEDSPSRDKGKDKDKDKDKDKEASVEKRERKDDRTHSDSHKSKHTEKEKDSKKDHKERESSSSHKHRHRDKDKEKDKEVEKEKETVVKSVHKTEESSKRKNSDSESKSDESSPAKAKVPKLLVDGIDSSMGTSFEEALGMISVSKGAKISSSSKKSPKAGASSSSGSSSGIFAKPSSRSPIESKTPPMLVPTAKLEPLDPSIALDLPAISPNYKPMPLNPTVMECVFSQNKPQKRLLSDEEALHQGISSKTIRTKVYSGVRTGVLQQVPPLFDLCIRVLQKNIDALEYTGGVPFEVLKQVLDRATPQQLLIFEEYNPYLMEDSDMLWKQHCMRHYRGQKRQEMETWREMFLRCKDEQDRKLSMLAENIKQSQKIIQQPIRKTQLAYVDSMVKPPRNIMKKQEQYGTKSNPIATPAARVASLANLTPNASKIGDVRLRASAKAPDTVQIAVATSNGRPKKAPLMQKTINFMKGRFKR